MQNSFAATRWLVVIALTSMPLVGCQNLDRTQNGALLGSLLGAGTGAIVGHQTGNKEKGALWGLAAGGLTGGLIGNAQENKAKADAALTYAHHQDTHNRQKANAVTNEQVIDMVRQGTSDHLIVRVIQDRGGNFDTRPSAIPMLHQNGVSDSVIQAMIDLNQYGN